MSILRYLGFPVRLTAMTPRSVSDSWHVLGFGRVAGPGGGWARDLSAPERAVCSRAPSDLEHESLGLALAASCPGAGCWSMMFSADGKKLAAVTADRTGCQGVRGLGQVRWTARVLADTQQGRAENSSSRGRCQPPRARPQFHQRHLHRDGQPGAWARPPDAGGPSPRPHPQSRPRRKTGQSTGGAGPWTRATGRVSPRACSAGRPAAGSGCCCGLPARSWTGRGLPARPGPGGCRIWTVSPVAPTTGGSSPAPPRGPTRTSSGSNSACHGSTGQESTCTTAARPT